ncbi:MAG: hypothetical protein D8M58_10315 [Calditrichaeota bacterium]|nr:MAG: hypothetical protein DWQ03_09690 [Calditrichota bacterium]MBL1205783.1 hypothetical protein [Calditrichota bacterium]NOG45611.1 SpoIIE family protein phosphatase [Calditrichota bacterium]
MKLSEELQKEAMAAYNAYWESYLKGDIKTMASYIHENFAVVGSTEGEIFFNKENVVNFYKASADQIAGKFEIRNRDIKILPIDGQLHFTELSDGYILLENEWSYYSKLRLTSLLTKEDDGWKFIQQHGSIPDSKTQEGEQIAFDKISRENLELRDAVKRRTVELESKNRELEIEAALERVRTVAMGMKESADMLKVCRSISEQLESLNIRDIRNIQTAIIYEAKGTYLNFEYYRLHDKTFITEVDYKSHPKQTEFAKQMLRSANAVFSARFEGAEIKEWLAHQSRTNQFVDSYLKKATSLDYYYHSVGPVALGMSTYSALNEEGLQIFKRFRNVFELAYKRYIDIEQAEAQTREAQIEVALEKVRSRTMAMQHSNELSETTYLLFQQFGLLGEAPSQFTIGIIDESKRQLELWLTLSGNKMDQMFSAPFDEPIVINKIYTAWKKQNKSLVIDLSGDELKAYNNFRNDITEYKEYNDFKDKQGIEKRRVISCAFFSKGLLSFAAPEPRQVETIQLLERFAVVFEQTYTRFLDLQKAEAQTREAQIETALERVRSRSMAMHISDELVDASDVMFDQLKKLGIKTLRIGICTIDSETGAAEVWSRSEIKGKVKNTILGIVPLGTHPVFDAMVKAWRENKPYFISQRVGAEVKEYYKTISSCLSYPEPKTYNEQESISAFFFDEGSLNVISLEPLHEEEIQILVRFAKVFGQTYTRFLDLQKSEAQTRESQIETALERVRAVAMAMRKPDNLLEVGKVLFTQLKALGFDSIRNTQIDILNDEKGSFFNFEYSDYGVSGVTEVFYESHPIVTQFVNDVRSSTDAFFFRNVTGKELDEWRDHRKQANHLPDAELEKATSLYYYCYSIGTGALGISSFEEINNESLEILKRFRNVFNLSHQRYIDISQAEAQAKEAQIEAALERVRSKTMAMQKSEELKEVIQVVYEQFVQLNIHIEHTGFIMDYKAREDMHIWLADQNGAPSEITIPYFDSEHWNSFNEAKEKGKDFFANTLNFKQKNRFYKKLFKHIPDLPEEAKEFYLRCEGLAISTVLIENVGLYIENFSGIPYSDEENNILLRFGKVFQQTYTRFLDLQNAEEQNKIIQAENERKTQELEEARELQLAMLPKELPKFPNLEIAVYMQTATEVGGDYYDFSNKDDASLNIAIGDATGHGMKAGIMVSSMKSIFTTNSPKMDIDAFFETANSGVKSMKLKRMMMGFSMLNIDKNKIKLINAGMPPVFLYRKESESVEEITEHGMPIGAMSVSKYNVIEKVLQKGDVLLLMSDGMPELHNDKNEMYGYERLHNGFENVAKKTPNKIIEYLKNEGASWTNNQAPDDDVTFVVIKAKE